MNNLTSAETQTLIEILKVRFEKNTHRHLNSKWSDVEQKLLSSPDKLFIINEMERTGGEPDVVDFGHLIHGIVYCDCSAESPKGRRSYCYDKTALDARKDFPPQNSVIEVASELGITLLNEDQYRYLQQFGPFDTKTSSWIITPEAIRKLDGAIYGDYRYGTTFIYHNGASSYYAARGFRGFLVIE